MKVLLCSALLLSGLAFGKKAMSPIKNDGVKRVVKCAKKCGAKKNSVSQILDDHASNFCERVRLMQGCYCGTMQQVNSSIKQCKK